MNTAPTEGCVVDRDGDIWWPLDEDPAQFVHSPGAAPTVMHVEALRRLYGPIYRYEAPRRQWSRNA